MSNLFLALLIIVANFFSSDGLVTINGRLVDIPWEYKGFQSFPSCWFGANPTGLNPGEPNTTMAVMAKHQLVGWGWQQGMYDFPCKALSEEQCLQYAAQSFSIYTIKNGTGLHPSFVYRNMAAALLNFGHDVGAALNCSANFSTWPTLTQACGLSDPKLQAERKEWFLHDKEGRICGGRGGTPAFQMSWQKASDGAVQWWDEVIGGWLAENLSPASAVFMDDVDGLGCGWSYELANGQGNCSVISGGSGFDPQQVTPAARLADSRASMDILTKVAARLAVAKKAVIINSGRLIDDSEEDCLLKWPEFLRGIKAIPNVIWFREAWNATKELPTALALLKAGIPKLIHYFGTNDTLLESQLASFFVVQGPYDYFAMSSEWTDGGMWWHWEFDSYKCGKPMEDPQVNGTLYTRHFENCFVRYDTACPSIHNDGCGMVENKTHNGVNVYP